MYKIPLFSRTYNVIDEAYYSVNPV